MNSSYEAFAEQSRKIAMLRSAVSFLSWDQATYMPLLAGGYRGQQMGFLSGLGHQLAIEKSFLENLENLLSDEKLGATERLNVRETHRMIQDILSVPTALIEKQSQSIAEASDAWRKAREANDFGVFTPALQTLIDLKKEELTFRPAAPDGKVYSQLIRPFDPGILEDELDQLFSRLKTGLLEILPKIPLPATEKSVFQGDFPEKESLAFAGRILEAMGFDTQRGRIDTTIHPFCMGLHPTDVRITYRHKKDDLSFMLWGLIHEAGHGLYEQGLNPEAYGLPAGSFASLSVHESQSRFWENNISRSAHFWKFAGPIARSIFPDLQHVDDAQFYQDANRVGKSLIRIDADELTYHFHVIIRYEIEQHIFRDGATARDIPELWKSKYESYLGQTPPNDCMGALQDVHWSHGMFGYFPTYTIGSLMAAQIHSVYQQSHPNWAEELETGNLLPVKNWLNHSIHQYGMEFQAQELCTRLSGEPLNEKYFLDYVRKKFRVS